MLDKMEFIEDEELMHQSENEITDDVEVSDDNGNSDSLPSSQSAASISDSYSPEKKKGKFQTVPLDIKIKVVTLWKCIQIEL